MLLVHSIDRLARNLQDLLSIATTMKEKGVTVTFPQGEDRVYRQWHGRES
nr:recombinase family protein [uncultured Bilophila sp.]